MNTVTKEKKEFLYNDIDTFLSFKKKQDRVFEVVEELTELSVKALGSAEVNYIEFLEEPATYLINNYWTIYKPAAPHLEVNKISIFQNHTNCDVNHLNALGNKFREAMKDMQQHLPSVIKTGLKSNLHIKSFDKFLDKNKAKKYHALVKFVKAAEEISGIENTHNINLVRFCSGLRLEGLDIKIDFHKFCN